MSRSVRPIGQEIRRVGHSPAPRIALLHAPTANAPDGAAEKARSDNASGHAAGTHQHEIGRFPVRRGARRSRGSPARASPRLHRLLAVLGAVAFGTAGLLPGRRSTHRGHGDSAKPGTGYRFEDFARDLRDVMDELGIERAVVVGHSMGSLVATRFALDNPSRVEALVLIGACATLRGNEAIGALSRDGVAEMMDPVDAAFVRAFQESTLARPVPPAFLDTVVAESGKVPARVWRDALRAMLEEDFSGELRNISAPALVVWGDRDGVCSRMEQERLIAALPAATLVVHEGAGHAPQWEDPRRVVADITGFLARTP
ncbi:MAG: alpha/beta fold hydrolase [Rhodospirillales bacterium]|nr:alpha/beta fold hydrolase [Rhodospirillales bacterium]